MKVVFKKDHLHHSAGEKKEIEDGLGNYLYRVGVVTIYQEKKDDPSTTEKVQLSVVKEKKDKSGPGK